jgi:hypothetical protein
MTNDERWKSLRSTVFIAIIPAEWIRSLISFFDRIYWINGIFFACGEIFLGLRPFYPDDPVNPV